MKKFLSLVLALVMTMSLVTVSAGAKDFGDSADLSGEAYEEAVNVMSEMGIIDGYSDGDFRPQGTLTRQAAAKIIACMMLGKTTAESLGTSAAPFKDVPAGSSFAGYIAFCVERGLIDGYGDGTFRPTNTLTGFAFLKMLLGALGYDSTIEGYTGTNWTVNVAGRAYEIGLTDGNDNFVGSKACTREEAALYAVNTLKATLVEYANKGSSITINGAEIVTGASEPTYVTSSIYNQATSINDDKDNASGDYTVEFAERYQTDLRLDAETDVFGRPARVWSWKGEEIGTYVDYSKMVAEYTTKVEYQDLYDAVGKTAAEKYDMDAYVDGVDNVGTGAGEVSQAKITRKNDDKVGSTGNGVLTQVFVDVDNEEFTVTSINTYLAQAISDYSESSERLNIKIYTGLNTSITRYVDNDDFDVSGYEKDDVMLVTMSGTRQVIESVEDPEVVSEVSISSYSVDKDTAEAGKYKLGQVTADGTKYSTAVKSFWDADFLYDYNDNTQQLKDYTYNLYLDPYGYVVGLQNVEDTTNYLFIVGYDIGSSVLAKTLDKALVIFPDGKMETITCYEKDGVADVVADDEANVNQWWTYSVDSDGNYVLKGVAEDQFRDYDTNRVLDVENPTLKGHDSYGATQPVGDWIAYGNSESVYITVEADKSVDKTNGSIVDVTNVTTGIRNTSIDMSENTTSGAYGAYVLYDGNYVKYAVVVGEDGSVGNRFVYLTDGIGDRSYDAEVGDDGYYWSYDAIVDKQLVETDSGKGGFNTLVEKDTESPAKWLMGGSLYKASYDADGYAKKMELMKDNWTTADTNKNKDAGYVQITSNTGSVGDTFAVTLRAQTLYLNTATFSSQYVLTADDCVFFVQNTDTVNGSEYVQYSDIDAALAATGAVDGETYYITGRLVAICDETTGFANTIIIRDSKFENKGETPVASSGYKVVGFNANPLAISADNSGITLKYAKVVDNAGADKNYGNTATLTTKVEFFSLTEGWKTIDTVEQTVTGFGTDNCGIADGTGVKVNMPLVDGQYRVTMTLSNRTIGTLAVGEPTLVEVN